MKLILTRELGRLTRWLRILGLDTEYFRGNTSSLIMQALRDERIIVTRNHGLTQSRGIRIILLQSEKLKEQVAEAIKALQVKPDQAKMFSRCIVCNEELVKIDKVKVKEKVPDYVFQTQNDFITCAKCQRIYWQGTHWGNAAKTLEEIWSS